MTRPEILIACIGNIFLGDDGFGTEVARGLAQRSLPPEVVVKDFGIRGLDLTYALLEPYRLIILVDACRRGGLPGTVYLLEPEPVPPDAGSGDPPRIDSHAMNPMAVLSVVHSLGGSAARILIVACEPADTGTDERGEGEGKLGLSAPVEAAIGEAIALIERTIASAFEEREASLRWIKNKTTASAT